MTTTMQRSATGKTCRDCGRNATGEHMLVKTIIFRIAGRNGRMVRSRSVAWVCDLCVAKDPDWNRQPFDESPRLRDFRTKEAANGDASEG